MSAAAAQRQAARDPGSARMCLLIENCVALVVVSKGLLMNPAEVLDRLAEKYAQCRSYSDRGTVEFDDVEEKTQTLEFSTRFFRPTYFSFEWQDYGPNRGKSDALCVLWSKDGITNVLNRWGVESLKSLSLAIAGATGCSAGAAYIVSSLLLAEVRDGTRHLLTLTEIQSLPSELFEDEHCFVLEGSLFKSRDTTLWVSQRDFALRRLREDRSWTAEESQKEHDAILSNKELMQQLEAAGIAPPKTGRYSSRRFVSDYTFRNVVFDGQIDELADPSTNR